jgi:hypothetical protein
VLEAFELVLQGISSSKHQYRCVFECIGAQLATKLQAIQSRQDQVEDDGVVIVYGRQVQAGHTVTGRIDHVAFGFQVVPQAGGQVCVVLDD